MKTKFDTELRKLMAENPDLPVKIIVYNEMGVDEGYIAEDVTCRVGEAITYKGIMYTDREDLEDVVREEVSNKLDASDEVIDKNVKNILSILDHDWEKVILIITD